MSGKVASLPGRSPLRDGVRAAELHVLALPDDVPADLRAELLARVRRRAPRSGEWDFLMLNPAQNKLVGRWLREGPDKLVGVALWMEMLDAVDWNTGVIGMTRAEMMAACGGNRAQVSRVLKLLLEKGALIRCAGEAGKPGQKYRLNPWVGTRVGGRAGDDVRAADAAPGDDFDARQAALPLNVVPLPSR